MNNDQATITKEIIPDSRAFRAAMIKRAGDLESALEAGLLPKTINTTLSEALVLGLLRQQVNAFIVVFGHGSTEIGEVLRIYQQAGILRTYNVRNEIEASHAASALRWVTGEKAAVVTSIGPGALQALAASITPASDGLGVWYLLGDETTQDEGPNMQQIPKAEQGLFLKLFSTMGQAYSLHTPLALPTALRRGLNTVDHPYRAGPFYLLMPMNTQSSPMLDFNLDELPYGTPASLGPAADNGSYQQAAAALADGKKIVVKIGGGARYAGPQILEFLELVDGVAVTSPIVSGVIPYKHPRNMTVGGSKGSLSGNYAMENADLLVAIGTRFVCQSDSSRTGYPNVKKVININADLEAATHYQKTIPLLGDAAATLDILNKHIRKVKKTTQSPSDWYQTCYKQKLAWEVFKTLRYQNPTLYDDVFKQEVLTQPAAIKTATDWARIKDVVTFFDAGDVQANGFQIVEDDRLGQTYTDTGASYMGFAVSALLSTAITTKPFYGLAISGDGSFMMNPQILIDGVEHGAKGCILLLDNRSMAAITGLQVAQYGAEHATRDSVVVDYVALAQAIKGVKALDGGRTPQSLIQALNEAHEHPGLSLIYVPVYSGSNELGGMGVFGRWNVGNWVSATQAMRHKIGL